MKKETLIQSACNKVPAFGKLHKKLLTHVRLNGKSESTLYNYSRSLAKMALYFKCSPLELTDDQINDYLLMLRDTQNPSPSYFKHTVYGLRSGSLTGKIKPSGYLALKSSRPFPLSSAKMSVNNFLPNPNSSSTVSCFASFILPDSVFLNL